MAKPRIFIGSSTEGIPLAKALELHLARQCEVTVWDSGVFKLGAGTVEALEEQLARVEFAVLILSPDDEVVVRGKEFNQARDNVLFELGLFMGRLGRRRAFAVCDPSQVKIPSDFYGLTVATYDSGRSDGNIQAMMSPVSTQILEAVRSEPPLAAEPLSNALRREMFGVDELYLEIVKCRPPLSAVVVSAPTTDWSWKLFPTLLQWACQGTRVTVFCPQSSGSGTKARQEAWRRRVLRSLGFAVCDVATEVSGFFLDADNPEDIRAYILPDAATSGFAPIAVPYVGQVHAPAALALLARLPDTWRQTPPPTPPRLVSAGGPESVINVLRSGVSQYKIRGVDIVAEEIPISRIDMISPYTRAYKYEQMLDFRQAFLDGGIPPFQSAMVAYGDGQTTVCTPPVAELHGDRYVLVEGNTRANLALQSKEAVFFALVVKGVEAPLPGTPFPLSDAKIVARTLPPDQRMLNFDYDNFRHIERATHPY